jgi:hypothetical protein
MQSILKLYANLVVAHACNPSYSGVRDQEDYGSKPPKKNPSQKKGLVEWLKV